MRRGGVVAGLLMAGAALADPAGAQAGGFVQPEGGYFVKAWNRTLAGDKLFDVSGDVVDAPESFQDHQLNVYAEYGLNEDVTLLMHLAPFGLTRYAGTTRIYASTMAVGVRHRLLGGARPLALEVRGGGRPAVGDAPLATGMLDSGPFVVRSTLPTLFLDVELQAGLSLPHGFWMTAGAGARQHTRDGLSPALFGGAQVGWSASFGLVVDLHASAYFSVERPAVNDLLGVGQTDYIGVGLSAAYWITEGFGVTLGVDGAPLARANAGAAPLQIGVVLKD